ncbi:MAG: VOC family protein [Bacteroidota bacterium]
MRPKKVWANLGVKDVARTREFYSKLGIKPNKGFDKSNELTSFLFGDDEFIIHFFENASLQKAMKGEMADLTKGNEIIFTLWAYSKEETNNWAEEIKNAGGKLFSNPEEFGEGYYGFVFADPDGHKWNVFHM